MSAEKSFHMTPEEFRRQGHAVVDWIADYHSRVESFPVLSRVQPGEVRSNLPPAAPEHGEAFDRILGDIERVILPGITHWQSPNFYAYFPANASGPAILGDLLASGLGVQGMLWSTSPACTELETHVLDWLVPMLGLPEKFLSTGNAGGGGVIQDTASSASLCALLAARERTTKFASNRVGCDGRLIAYCSTQTHSSVEKAMKISGMGSDNLRHIEVDQNFSMRPEALAHRIRQDVEAGLLCLAPARPRRIDRIAILAVIYFIGGTIGLATQLYSMHEPLGNLLGASANISAVIGAFFVFFMAISFPQC